MKKDVILAVDAGGQSYKFALVDYATLSPLAPPAYLAVDSFGPASAILGVWHEVIRQGLRDAGQQGLSLRAMACSCPGPFDYLKGISLMDHKWPALKGIDLPEDFHKNGLPADVPVFFCHDGNSLVLGEMAVGTAKGYSRVGGYIIGTGLGFGACCDGKLQIDGKGSPVFRMYSRPYRGETIEAWAASKGVPRWYAEITGKPTNLTAKDIGERAEKGEKAAIEAYESMGRAIAEVSLDIIRDYRIQCLVFGGRISNSFPVFAPAFAEKVRSGGLPVPRMVQSRGGETLSMSGASYYAKLRLKGEQT